MMKNDREVVEEEIYYEKYKNIPSNSNLVHIQLI